MVSRGLPSTAALLSVACVAVLLAQNARAQLPSATPAAAGTTTLAQVLDLFNKLDTNNDGKITVQEFQQIFVAADKNGDGFLTVGEFDPATIVQLDTNKDGKLSVTEFLAAFQKTDTNKDGYITINEFRAR